MRFVDTNVLLYAIELDPSEAEKRDRARLLLRETELAISVQVLHEFYFQATRPSRKTPLTHDEALCFIRTLLATYKVEPVTTEIFEAAVSISRRYGLSYWDGAILAAARLAGCDAVYSEDMSHEQDYDGIRVINPFVKYE